MCDVLRPPVAPEQQTSGNVLLKPAEGIVHPLADGLQRRPLSVNLRRVPAHDFLRIVANGSKEPTPAGLHRSEVCGVRSPITSDDGIKRGTIQPPWVP